MNKVPSLNIFKRALQFKDRTAIINYPNNKTEKYTYNDLLNESESISNILNFKKKDLEGDRVAIYSGSNFDYVRSQWGVYRAGGVVVPLSYSNDSNLPFDIKYKIENSKCSTILTTSENYSKILEVAREMWDVKVIEIPKVGEYTDSNVVTGTFNTGIIDTNRNASIIYTSGTTNRPKGVVSTHANIEAQIGALVNAWEWTERDHILEFLPLHHVHGIINVLGCALWSGAICEMMPKFDCKMVIDRLLESGTTTDLDQPLSLFMAVPTIYAKLVKYVQDNVTNEQDRAAIERAFQRLRLCVSGSSALPEKVKNDFHEISGGHNLLERYGMTEIGMCLGNPLHGDRVSGTVGFPFPNVETKINEEIEQDPIKQRLFKDSTKQTGELLVKGPQVFKEYFENPVATKESFDKDGYFKTGDIVEKDLKTGRFKILGRSSVDIIKSAGFKISALEIEREILDHPDIDECAVIGIPDNEYGQTIAALLVVKKGRQPIPLDDFKSWCKQRLSHYKVPKVIKFTNEIPKNAMSKVNKKELIKLF